MTITVNGEPREVPAGSSLEQLVACLTPAPQTLATAVNQQFIAREARAACALREGDAVFTFQAITGG
ncbi:sulfur carrier protein ThiS [Ramlibacter rhizophilus]|uniref:Sulfur carrier protein ThiS n=1 Tax=Ramlibacter rhizophilus TaxID=1781167 RepID=A0A4Z0BJ67_9BURK|nr:sulfur carrier protein ThiS [Ramlibacter rhizophilus]